MWIKHDDVNNSTEDVQETTFSIGDKTYVLDLGTESRSKLHEALAPFVEAAERRVAEGTKPGQAITLNTNVPAAPKPEIKPTEAPVATKRVARKQTAKKATAKKNGKGTARTNPAVAEENRVIRTWAIEKGIDLPSRGRIPNEVRRQWAEDTGQTSVHPEAPELAKAS